MERLQNKNNVLISQSIRSSLPSSDKRPVIGVEGCYKWRPSPRNEPKQRGVLVSGEKIRSSVEDDTILQNMFQNYLILLKLVIIIFY